MKKIFLGVVCLTLVFSLSIVVINRSKNNKIDTIEKTIYPISVDFDSVQKNYRQGVLAYNYKDKAKHVGFMDNVFVGKVESLVGTSYTDVSIKDDMVYGTSWTNYKVTVLKNIKGNLKENATIPIRKWAGLNFDNTLLTIDEYDIMPKEGYIYIFCAFVDEDGELYISCNESNILLGKDCENEILEAFSDSKTIDNNSYIYQILNEYKEAEAKHDNSVDNGSKRYTPKQEYILVVAE